MTSITCPNCRHILEVKDRGPAPSQADQVRGAEVLNRASAGGPNVRAYAAVTAMVRDLSLAEVDSLSFPELLEQYETRVAGDVAPRLTPAALATALKAAGCTRWRTATTRGYHIPRPADIPSEFTRTPSPTHQGVPVSEDFKVRPAGKTEAELFREMIESHGSDRTTDGQPAPPPLDRRPYSIIVRERGREFAEENAARGGSTPERDPLLTESPFELS